MKKRPYSIGQNELSTGFHISVGPPIYITAIVAISFRVLQCVFSLSTSLAMFSKKYFEEFELE